MPITVWYTIDLFFRDWDKNNADSALWLTVQPHVEQKYLEQWLPNCGKLSETDNRIWTSDNPIDPQSLVPLPIPGDADVSISLMRGGTSLLDHLNERQRGPYLTDPDKFAEHNRPRQPDPSGDDSHRPVPIALGQGIYARIYAAQLADAYRGAQDADAGTAGRQMEAALQLAFHGGTTRHISDDWFSNLDAVDLIKLDPATEHAESGVMITNVHSLLGMQFLVAGRDKAAKLASPGKVSLTINLKSADASWSGDFAKFVPDGELEQWFDWFAQDQDVAKNFQITPTVISGFDHRIYVHDAPEAFSRLGDKKIWRRRTQEGLRNGRSLSDAKRFIIRPAKQSDDVPPKETLSIQAYTAVDCDLRQYRSFKRVDSSAVPLRLRPKPQSRDRFAACFTEAAQPQGMIVLDQDANPVQLEWLGAYVLPWDAADDEAGAWRSTPVRTVLFWGAPTGQEVTVLIPASSSPIDCTWVRNVDPNYDADQFGRRWETIKFDNAKSGLPFDAFSLSDDVGDIAAGVIFPDSLNFVSARSVEAVEGALKMTYPYPDIVHMSTIDPPSHYAHDLVNYNALNIRDAASDCGGKLLNPDSSDYAVWHSQVYAPGLLDQTFHYRFAVPSDPDVNDENLSPTVVGQSFSDQFFAAGKPRPLNFELVHTYGTGICFANGESAARPHARLPMLPNEVSSQLAAGGTNANTAFLWISYATSSQDPKLDKIELSFDESCLSIPDLGMNPPEEKLRSARMRMISAFRSLAEIGYAGRVTLTVRGCNFDYTKLVGQGPQVPLAQGLVDNVDAGKWTHDLSDLAAKCRDRLTNPSAPLDYPIELTAEETKQFRNCNLIEFSLLLERTTATSPIAPSTATLLRIIPDLGSNLDTTNLGYDDKGQKTKPAESAANGLYASWQDAMSVRVRPVLPNRASSQVIRDVFAAGGDLVADADKSNQAAAWIAPPDAPAEAGEWPELYFFPLGFVPLQRSPALGAATTTIVRRFFDALAFVVDVRPGAWNLPWSKQQWSDHFKNLEANAQNLLDVISDALALVKPAHRADDVDKPVAGQITTFLSAAEQARWTVAKGQLAITAPGIFGSAKGFQVTAIGTGSGSPIRSDLFQIVQEHNTTPGIDDGKLLRTTDIRQGLPGAGVFFGLETLDDVAYGDRYAIGNLAENSFEKLIDQASGGSNTSVKAFLPSVPGKAADLVALPSREPLTLPHHLFTGTITGADTAEWWKPDDHRYISSMALVGKSPGIRTIDGSDKDGLLRLAGGTGAGPSLRASGLDRCMINAVFRVNSDEEGDFVNDTFSVRYSSDPTPSAVEPQDNKPIEFFAKLLSSSFENNEMLNQVADSPNVKIMEGAVKAATPASPATDACEIRLGTNGYLDIVDTHQRDGWCISAALYQIPQAGKGVCRAYLIVTFNVPIWQIATLGLYQSRNVSALAVPRFAPDFGQTLGPVGSDVVYIPHRSSAYFSEKPPLTLPRQPMTVEALIQQLVTLQYIDAAQWKGVLGEITIHHRQMVNLMSDDGSGEGKGILLDTGKYALVRCEYVPKQTPTAVDVFVSPYEDFFVDFIWHQNGNEFFRILDFPVTVAHAL